MIRILKASPQTASIERQSRKWSCQNKHCVTTKYVFKRRLLSTNIDNNKKAVQVWEFPASENTDDGKCHGVLYKASTTPDSPISQWKREDPLASSEPLTLESISKKTFSHFLPAQYPKSVAPEYLRFVSFCFTASVAGSAAMVLSTQTLLLAVGVVGSNVQQASVMAGAFNWVMKDFVGQLGGVLFASQMGKTRAFDADPKRWRMVAAIALDGATLLEILSPLFHGSLVLPVASVANIGKNIGFLTASASRAALHNSVAITGNLGDVTAKSGSQSIMASLLGTSVGISLSSLLAHDTYNFAMGFCVLTVIHQGCNYLSVKAVALSHFNRQRLNLVLEEYIQSKEVMNPSEIAVKEAFFPFVAVDETKTWLKIGKTINSVYPVPHELEEIRSEFADEFYLIKCKDSIIYLNFLADAKGQDLIRGMFHASLVRQAISEGIDETFAGKMTYERLQTESLELISQLTEKGWKIDTQVTNIESSDAQRICFEK